MKKKLITSIILTVCIAIAASQASAKKEEESSGGVKKIIAIDKVDTGYMGFQNLQPGQLADLFKSKIKKQLEETGRYVVVIPQHGKTKTEEAEEKPAPTPKTQAEMFKYMEKMQEMAEQMQAQASGKYFLKEPVAAQAIFNFTIQKSTGRSGTGGAFGMLESATGVPSLGMADYQSESVRIQLTATQHSPDSGAMLDSFQTDAEKIRFNYIGPMNYYAPSDSIDNDKTFNKLFSGAINKAISWIDKKMASQPWEGQIFSAKGGKLLLNAGSSAGIRPGMTLDVVQREAVSGKGIELGSQDVPVGKVEVTDVSDQFSGVRIISGTAKVGSIVREAK
jgi:hypothetical protein